MSYKLVLFDIDGTLMNVGLTHKLAFKNAFKKLLGHDFDIAKWTHSGCTDLEILHKVLDSINADKSPKIVKGLLHELTSDFLEKDLSHALLIDGVQDLLSELSEEEGIKIGVVTGNVDRIADKKLSHFKISHFFEVGGFGNLSTKRYELITHAIQKSAALFGHVEKSNVFIIGDTNRDINAAKLAKVKVIAVATGSYTKDDLAKAKPDYLFDNLKDTKMIIDVIKNG